MLKQLMELSEEVLELVKNVDSTGLPIEQVLVLGKATILAEKVKHFFTVDWVDDELDRISENVEQARQDKLRREVLEKIVTGFLDFTYLSRRNDISFEEFIDMHKEFMKAHEDRKPDRNDQKFIEAYGKMIKETEVDRPKHTAKKEDDGTYTIKDIHGDKLEGIVSVDFRVEPGCIFATIEQETETGSRILEDVPIEIISKELPKHIANAKKEQEKITMYLKTKEIIKKKD